MEMYWIRYFQLLLQKPYKSNLREEELILTCTLRLQCIIRVHHANFHDRCREMKQLFLMHQQPHSHPVSFLSFFFSLLIENSFVYIMCVAQVHPPFLPLQYFSYSHSQYYIQFYLFFLCLLNLQSLLNAASMCMGAGPCTGAWVDSGGELGGCTLKKIILTVLFQRAVKF